MNINDENIAKAIKTKFDSRGMSLSEIANKIPQPRGGYLPRLEFDEELIGNEEIPGRSESIKAVNMSHTIEAMVKYILTKDVVNSFELYNDVRSLITESAFSKLKGMLKQDTSDSSIIAAVKLSSLALTSKTSVSDNYSFKNVNPNKVTRDHIRTMVERSNNILNKYSDKDHIKIDINSGHLVTKMADKKILWSMRVISGDINKNHTMSILLNWRMSANPDSFTHLGIFNPRKGIAYIYDLSKLDSRFIEYLDSKLTHLK